MHQAYHLLCNHYHCLGGESPVAVIEEVFEGGSEKVNDEDIVKAFLAEVIYIRDTG